MQQAGGQQQNAKEVDKPRAVARQFHKHQQEQNKGNILGKIGVDPYGPFQLGNVPVAKANLMLQTQARNAERQKQVQKAQKCGVKRGNGKAHAARVTPDFLRSTVWTRRPAGGIVLPMMKRSFTTFLNSWQMRLFTWRYGKLVGTDSQGNQYYHAPKAKLHGQERRWVIYGGNFSIDPEASAVPPEWHGWLHHSYDAPLPANPAKGWVKPHQPNLTGTAATYRPPGHQLEGGKRAAATGDYQAWSPQE